MATVFERRPEGAPGSSEGIGRERWNIGGNGRILVALNGSAASLSPLTTALQVAKWNGRSLDVLLYSCGATLPGLLMYFFDQLQRNGIHFDLFCRHGPLGTEIAEFASARKLSLVLIDSLGHWGTGGDSAGWQRTAGCPVYELSTL
jgi:hypothetical protein